MLPDDPRHGTYAGWQAHYTTKTLPSCDSCSDARRRYQMRRDKETQLGRPRRLPLEPVRAHLRILSDAGMSLGDIAETACLNRQTVESINAAHYKTVSARVGAALLALEPQPGSGTVPVVGSARRLRALAWLGWRPAEISAAAEAAGYRVSVDTMKNLRAPSTNQERVAVGLALGIAAAYEALSMRLAPSTRANNVVRAYARNHGFGPPMAWDDIDDPDETPKGLGASTVDRAEVLADVDSWGGNATDAARALGIDRATVQTWAQRHGCSELYRRLAGREAIRGNQWTEGAA